MAKLRTENYGSENLNFKYDVNIDKEGNFTTTIPQEIVSDLEKVGIEFGINRLKRKGFFSALSLDELKENVKEVIDQYSNKDLIEEKIIIKYSVGTICSYWKKKDGTICPNGYWDDGAGDDKGSWANSSRELHACNRSPFGLEVFIEIRKVKVWKFPNGETKKEYERLEDDDTNKDEVLHWLNSIVSISKGEATVKEMDYSLEAGNFFKNLLMYIFNMNEKMIEFFGKDFDLSKIDFNRLPALGFDGDTKLNEDKN